MIVIAGSARVRAEDLERAAAAGAEMGRQSRAEDGCLDYRFSFDLEDPTVVRVFECWASEEALAAHFAAEHFAAFGTVIAEVVDGESEFTRYDVVRAGPLFG